MDQYLETLRNKLKQESLIYMRIKVIPGSAKTKFAEFMEGTEPTLKIRIAAPPEKNKANKVCLKFLSTFFQAKAELVSGHASPLKLIRISI